MRSRLAALVAMPIFAPAACGQGKQVDTAAYTCAQFNKSLRTKDDNTAGNYINQLREKAKLGQSAKTERAEITLGIIFTCRGKPGSTKPANQAIVVAKQVKAGKFKLPSRKKSSN